MYIFVLHLRIYTTRGVAREGGTWENVSPVGNKIEFVMVENVKVSKFRN